MNLKGLKQAAVLIAGMHPVDRRWIRQRLPSLCHSALDQLLDDLRRLDGNDPQVLREALTTEPSRLPPAEPPTPDVLLAGLQGLDPAWVACALRACAPDHAELYLASQSTAHALVVREALGRAPSHMPAKLTRVLTLAVRSRGEQVLTGVGT